MRWRTGHADSAEDLGKKPFLARGVDESTAGEGRGVQSAETAGADPERENKGSDGAEDDGAELHGDGGRGGDSFRGEHEDVSHVGEKIAEDDGWHGGMDDTGKITVRRDEFAHDITSLWDGLAVNWKKKCRKIL